MQGTAFVPEDVAAATRGRVRAASVAVETHAVHDFGSSVSGLVMVGFGSFYCPPSPVVTRPFGYESRAEGRRVLVCVRQ